MPVKAKYIKDLPLKRMLDGSESLLVQDLNGTQQAPLEVIIDEIKQNTREEVFLKQNGININDFDEETRRAILEAHEINVNYVLGDENVNPQNTTFFDIVVGKNKFNKNNCVFGYYIDYTNGVVRKNDGYCYVKHEKIESGRLYTMNSRAVQTCFYDSNKEYISGHLSSADSMSFTTPSNAKYFISSIPIDLIDQFMIVEGDDLGSYEPYTRTEFIKSVHIQQEPITTERLLDSSVTEDKVKDKAISPKKTTFFDIVVGKNKFNKNNIITGYYVEYSSGNINVNNGYCYAKYERIKSNTLYTLNLSSVQTAFYDVNKTYISGHLSSSSSRSFTTPENAKYFIVSVPIDLINQFMIVEGDTLGNYEQYTKTELINDKYIPFKLITSDLLENDSVTNEKIEDNSVTPSKTSFFEIVTSSNKFNKNSVTNGYYIDYTSGNINSNSGYCYSDYEEISENTYYTTNYTAIQICFYDHNKVYIDGHLVESNTKTFTSPKNSKYMRVSVAITMVDNVMIVEGTSVADYEPYNRSEKILSKYLPSVSNSKNYLTVDIKGNGDFTSLTEAVENANDGDMIFVKNGIYDDEIVRAWTKTLYIYGEDKNTTIIKNTTGDYKNPPLEMVSGSLKNLTIIADSNPDGFDGTPAYAIHIENNFMENKTFEIDNCNIISHVNFAIGCGLRKGCLLEITNSRLESFSEFQGGLYVHDTDVDSMVGLQKLRVKNTEILCNSANSSAQAIVLQSMHKDGSDFNCEFINTNARNIIVGNQNCAFRDASDGKAYDRPEQVPNISLSKASYGNSLNKMNYEF